MAEDQAVDVSDRWLFPFGAPAEPRPMRAASQGRAHALVVGVYPSALHVRWTPPAWASSQLGVRPVGALAVGDEPTVFWDGASPDAGAAVGEWKAAVGFEEGDEVGQWGHVSPAGNGTSGRPVVERVLAPLHLEPDETAFTDCVNAYFVKSGASGQGAAWRERYEPFARALGLPMPSIPPRPSPELLVRTAVAQHRDRLRREILAVDPVLVITLGEEARQVVAAIADDASGAPMVPLANATAFDAEAYGDEGDIVLEGHTMGWIALVHPGQRSASWAALHDAWIDRQEAEWADPAEPSEPCPGCGGSSWTPISYGLPGRELEESAMRGEVILGGCCIFEDAPTHECRSCGLQIGQLDAPR